MCPLEAATIKGVQPNKVNLEKKKNTNKKTKNSITQYSLLVAAFSRPSRYPHGQQLYNVPSQVPRNDFASKRKKNFNPAPCFP
jgi:hypothetical protein